MTGRHPRFGIQACVSFLLMAFLAMTSPAVSAQQSGNKEKLQQTKKKLEDEIRYTTALLEKTRKSKQSSMQKLELLSKQIRSRQALINNINRQLNDVQVQIEAEGIQLERMTKQLNALRSEYARMICYAHRTMNGHNKLMFIFSARDFNQAYQRLKYYQQYSSYRRTQVGRIEATRRAIDIHRKELENVKSEKLTLYQSQQQEKQKLDREQTEKAAAVREYTSKEKKLLTTLKKKQAAAAQLEGEIQKMIASDIRAAGERARKSAAKTGKTAPAKKHPAAATEMEFTPREKELSSSFSASKGRLPWPCEKGYISGSFGEHPHPVLERIKVKNNGIDIVTEPSATVGAVFGGKVSRVLSFPTLHSVVIIRHGDYLTVYSNLGEVRVKEGQEVTPRQAIGRVYTGAGEQHVELHFELWRGKVIQDPEDWLARKQ